ncbi:hypothetical protein [Inconstantimicrobium mannanitabidum]|uniref:Uncharacterized protein n=1 Tax=Inconstantimicrobium mannanitabidum TaxID=1604901 RepID=A0ACB5R9A6_9CLOT|nr:hypothetical protein [Clostridium sp. TW13]GKX65608.1 hypothetical protein rsdtw13_08660 [Clostridium sp. TW13]
MDLSVFDQNLISELSKKYVFETFDFSNKTATELLESYQKTFEELKANILKSEDYQYSALSGLDNMEP